MDDKNLLSIPMDTELSSVQFNTWYAMDIGTLQLALLDRELLALCRSKLGKCFKAANVSVVKDHFQHVAIIFCHLHVAVTVWTNLSIFSIKLGSQDTL